MQSISHYLIIILVRQFPLISLPYKTIQFISMPQVWFSACHTCTHQKVTNMIQEFYNQLKEFGIRKDQTPESRVEAYEMKGSDIYVYKVDGEVKTIIITK